MEYLIGPGDSGGGSFIFENNNWYLAGVHSGTYDLYAYPGAASNTSTYGDGGADHACGGVPAVHLRKHPGAGDAFRPGTRIPRV